MPLTLPGIFQAHFGMLQHMLRDSSGLYNIFSTTFFMTKRARIWQFESIDSFFRKARLLLAGCFSAYISTAVQRTCAAAASSTKIWLQSMRRLWGGGKWYSWRRTRHWHFAMQIHFYKETVSSWGNMNLLFVGSSKAGLRGISRPGYRTRRFELEQEKYRSSGGPAGWWWCWCTYKAATDIFLRSSVIWIVDHDISSSCRGKLIKLIKTERFD